MIGSFLTRGLVMIFGYAYPAYECYKAVEKNKPEMQQLRFWCQYWILVAALTIFERVGDAFASWVPLYCEAKLAFFMYLWFPKTRGTTYVYDSFFRPYVAKHEIEIDRSLIELRTKARDMAVICCRKAMYYGQTRFTEILQFVALQSTPKPQPKEKKQEAPEEEEQKQPELKETSQAASSPQVRMQSKKPQLVTKEPTSTKPLSSLGKQQQQLQTETKEAKASVSQTKLTPLPPPPSPSTATKPNADSAQPVSTEAEKASQVVAALPKPESAIQGASSAKETITEETLRVTRGSLRKARSTGAH